MRDDGAIALGVVAILILTGVVIFLTFVTVYIFFLLSLSRCLKKVSPENRAMEPGLVWLNLIPGFVVLWNFFTIIQIKESLSKEFKARGWPDDKDYGMSMGLVYAILQCCNYVLPYINLITVMVTPIFMIIYWVKIAGYRKQLESTQPADEYDAKNF